MSRPPVGYAAGAWDRFLVEIAELGERARLGDDLFEVVALARRRLDVEDDLTASGEITEPPPRRPWETNAEHTRRVEEHRGHRERAPRQWEIPAHRALEEAAAAEAAAVREMLADRAIEEAAASGERLLVSLTASGERRIRRLDPRAFERRRRIARGAAGPITASATTSEAFVLPRMLLDEIRDHAREQPSGFESCGGLIVRDDRRIVDYERLRNNATELGKAVFATSWAPLIGRRTILCHSHPRGKATPSRGDLRYFAARDYRRVFAIFAHDELRIFEIASNRHGFVERPVVVE